MLCGRKVCLAVLLLVSAGHAEQPKAASPSGEPCDGVLVPVAPSNTGLCIKPGSGKSFKDCPECPEMVVVPAGSFMMGTPESEPERMAHEGPQHEVTIGKPFAVGQFAVTFAEWDACTADDGCGRYRPDDIGLGRNDRSAHTVSWNDAQAYVSWLSKKTSKNYRLLSEAEREYVTRAGTTTPFWWGSSITPDEPNYDGSAASYIGGGAKGEYQQKTVPVGSFKPNPWGLYQVHSDVFEWVEDCYHNSYEGAPPDGSAWTTGECKYRVVRGGSWGSNPQVLPAAFRIKGNPVIRFDGFGIRVARTIAQ
jgi:formylglycine-generating enzyme required for sulfatase activity